MLPDSVFSIGLRPLKESIFRREFVIGEFLPLETLAEEAEHTSSWFESFLFLEFDVARLFKRFVLEAVESISLFILRLELFEKWGELSFILFIGN